MSVRLSVRSRWILIIVALFAVLLAAQAVSAAQGDKQPLLRPESGLAELGPAEEIDGAFSRLRRGDDRITTQLRSSAEPGTALTMWCVIFNAPENCDGPCGLGDILLLDDGDLVLDDDGNPVLNQAQIDAARISIVFGGDGTVANPGGRVALDGGLAVGEVPSGPAQVVIGHPDDGPVFGEGPVTGLEDAQAAEILVDLQSHGPAHDDPELLEQQTTMFFGACNPDPTVCPDDQFAFHR